MSMDEASIPLRLLRIAYNDFKIKIYYQEYKDISNVSLGHNNINPTINV